MHNLTLEELYRDLLEIKTQIAEVRDLVLNEHRMIQQTVLEVDKRLTRLEERVLFFSVGAGAIMGLIGEIVSRFLFD